LWTRYFNLLFVTLSTFSSLKPATLYPGCQKRPTRLGFRALPPDANEKKPSGTQGKKTAGSSISYSSFLESPDFGSSKVFPTTVDMDDFVTTFFPKKYNVGVLSFPKMKSLFSSPKSNYSIILDTRAYVYWYIHRQPKLTD